MDRRAFLFATTGTAAAFGIAGCLGAPGSDPQPENTPEQAVEQYFQALADGDRAARESILHSENPELEQLSRPDDGDSRPFDLELRGMTVVDSQQTNTSEVVLRRDDGVWRIWNGG